MINLKTNQSVSDTNRKNEGLEKKLVATVALCNRIPIFHFYTSIIPVL